jgi:hypothetical protein
MNGPQDDVRLPFSVMDPLAGDVYSVLWEPETLGQTGNALKILTSEVLSSVGQQVLQATLLGAMMSALQWPISECSSGKPDVEPDRYASSPDEARLPHRQSLVQRSRSSSTSRRSARGSPCPALRWRPTHLSDRILARCTSMLLHPGRSRKAESFWSSARVLLDGSDRHCFSKDVERDPRCRQREIRECLCAERLGAGVPL